MPNYTRFDGSTMPLSSSSLTAWLSTTAFGQTISSNAVNAQLSDAFRGATLIGTSGTTLFSILDSGTIIREAAGAGIDTVSAWCSYVLPSNVENLDIKTAYSSGTGNASANLLIASASNVTLRGGLGQDVLVGGTGATKYAMTDGDGRDVVYGFKVAGAAHDFLDLRGYGLFSFDDVKARITQQGADTLLTLSDTDALLLKNVQASSLATQNFLFNIDTSKYSLAFHDEFDSLSLYNGANGSGTWKTNFQSGAQSGANSSDSRNLWGNGEQQIYVDPSYAGTGTTALGLNPFSINNGVLNIHAQKTSAAHLPLLDDFAYTSGLLTTEKTFSQTYGYFEMRAMLPTGQGAWPAFWLLPADGSWPPELDVLESVGDGMIYNSSHSNDTGTHTRVTFATPLSTAGTAFHTYGVLWTASTLSYYIDGQQVASTATPADMNKPMYMLVNLAIGGYWAGNAPANFVGADLKVDYIRAYSLAASVHVATSSNDRDLGGADAVSSSFSYSLVGTAAHTLTLTGAAAISATANDLGNTLTGNAAANRLTGGGGADTLDGGAGGDRMAGKLGNDIYRVDNVEDVVKESYGQGHDMVYSTLHAYTLGANFEDLFATGTGDFSFYGNSLANHIVTGNGNDVLNGYRGTDTLEGGLGNDTYHVDTVGDVLIDTGGYDTVVSSTTWTLDAGFEALSLAGIGSINGTGNALDNMLRGNAAKNTLNGGTGADTMYGMGGNDIYIVDNAGDRTIEVENGVDRGGIDTIKTGLASWTLGQMIETLIFTGTGNFRGFGNAGDNTIGGGAGNDVLDGGNGADTLAGFAGNDVLNGGDGADVLTGGVGNDRFVMAKGQAQGDRITDFGGNGAAAGDTLALSGWGAGTTVTAVANRPQYWQIVDGVDHSVEIIHVTGSFVAADILII